MSAGRSASSLLLTLVATLILFVVFASASSLSVLENHAYMLEFGWGKEPDADWHPGSIIGGVCAPTTAINGFPLASTRQAEIPDNCLKVINPLAQLIDYALYFTVAAIIAVSVVRNIPDLVSAK